MKMKKATENQGQPANVAHKLVDKSHFLAKLKKNVSAWFRQSMENSTSETELVFTWGPKLAQKQQEKIFEFQIAFEAPKMLSGYQGDGHRCHSGELGERRDQVLLCHCTGKRQGDHW